ncbi:hypothetical protein L211DRAFT_423912 [Terfezia boudieri ATCC MYA-4762]|uniref:Uncharacterized protein n=1 Tax=Terfezia boudieri ATCC MYA-4762 TaxID=1051890 RepID=A0A3N4LFF3_9PEZI|nr:hypothetical protein L211DRAFT_423912 [Terfezia boudieri ATCC MYA-4762]
MASAELVLEGGQGRPRKVPKGWKYGSQSRYPLPGSKAEEVAMPERRCGGVRNVGSLVVLDDDGQVKVMVAHQACCNVCWGESIRVYRPEVQGKVLATRQENQAEIEKTGPELSGFSLGQSRHDHLARGTRKQGTLWGAGQTNLWDKHHKTLVKSTILFLRIYYTSLQAETKRTTVTIPPTSRDRGLRGKISISDSTMWLLLAMIQILLS